MRMGGYAMRRRSVLAAGAAGAAALLAGGTSAEAATQSRAATARAARPGDVAWASASLRDLAAGVGLRFGSALIPQDIETPSYAAIAGSQFSVVTPGNGDEMADRRTGAGCLRLVAGRRTRQFRTRERTAHPRAHALLAQPAARLADHR